ncbi:hypothetical protein QM012_005409 [Aureobasidium pullulans]|uniref:Uncharacterized protein n=1 Tax=Aureobasidium pullulans TaxID=5580 RepID=A0ABR0T6G2_AURPU
MSLAVQHESDLCLLPHTVAWPNQVAQAPVPAPPVAPVLPAPSTVSSVGVAPSGNSSSAVDDEDEEMDDEEEADDLGPSSPTTSDLALCALIDSIVESIHRAKTIGCYYMDRIDEVSIPDGLHDVVSSTGRRIEVDLAGMQHDASMILHYAVEELNTAADGLRDANLQEDQLEEIALSASGAINQIIVPLSWYLSASHRVGNTEEDMERLSMMHQAIVDKFDIVEEDEDEIEEDEDEY